MSDNAQELGRLADIAETFSSFLTLDAYRVLN